MDVSVYRRLPGDVQKRPDIFTTDYTDDKADLRSQTDASEDVGELALRAKFCEDGIDFEIH